MNYCIENDVQLDTSLYFTETEDNNQALIDFIDSRIKSVIAGFSSSPASLKQLEDKKTTRQMQKNTKRNGDFYEYVIFTNM